MIKKSLIIIALYISFICANTLSAEIEEVRLRFKPGLCKGRCLDLVHENLSKIRGAEEVYVAPDGTEAVVKWAPGAKFSWSNFNTAMRMVGLHIKETRIRVRGDVRNRGRSIELVSIDDRTPFALLGPIMPQRDQYVVTKNPENRPLLESTAQELIERSRDGDIAVISGPLFMPWRGQTPLYLIVEELKWDRPPEQQSQQRQRGRRR